MQIAKRWAELRPDLTSGFLVFLLALPLSLGIAAASGFPPVMGLLTATIGGLVGAWLSGSVLAVKGPAAGLIVVVAGAVADLGGGEMGWKLTAAAVVVAGFIQFLFGVLRWGRLADFFPISSIHGMMAAIGCIILAKQTPSLLGVDPVHIAGASPWELLLKIPFYGPWIRADIAWVGGISLAVFFLWSALPFRWARSIPTPVVVLACAIPLAQGLDLPETAFVSVEGLLGQVGIQASVPATSQWATFLKYVVMIAAVGTLESLLTVKAVDSLDPLHRKSDPNRDLRGLGLVNMISGLLGGLPMISEVARSSANVASGGRSRWSVFFHGFWMLIAVGWAVEGLRLIPTAALAALLIGVGYRLAHPKHWKSAWQVGIDQLAIFAVTVFFTLVEDLLVGIAAGIAVKGALHVFRGVAIRDLLTGKRHWETAGEVSTLVLERAVVFLHLPGLRSLLDQAPDGPHWILDVSRVHWMDHSAMEMLHDFKAAGERAGKRVEWKGLEGLASRSQHPLAVRSAIKPLAIPDAREPEHSEAGRAEVVTVDEVLETLTKVLPAQLSLRDFVHHNPLHAFDRFPFFEGIFKAARDLDIQVVLPLEAYRALHRDGVVSDLDVRRAIADRKGEGAMSAEIWYERMFKGVYPEKPLEARVRLRAGWKQRLGVNLDGEVYPRLFRWMGAFFDQGVAADRFPASARGLIEGLREMDQSSAVPLFRSSRVRNWLHDPDLTVEAMLAQVVGPREHWARYLWEQQMAHRGWSGFVVAVMQHPETLLDTRKVDFRAFVLLELLLECDAVDQALGQEWRGIGWDAGGLDLWRMPRWDEPIQLTEREEVLALWQCAFEAQYHEAVLAAVEATARETEEDRSSKGSFSAICCIDDREDSLRRHLESQGWTTWGAPGFFGVPFYFQPEGGGYLEKLAPVPVTPRHIIREVGGSRGSMQDLITSAVTYRPLAGLGWTFSLGGKALIDLAWDVLMPRKRAHHVHAFAHMDLDGKLQFEADAVPEFQDGLQVGFKVEEMADRVEALLKGIGWKPAAAQDKAFVLVLGHGSSSANNPHHAAYDCGACSGRPGGVNARVFAAMANRADVRKLLSARGLELSDGVTFIGALHDTARDRVVLYDRETPLPGAPVPWERLEESMDTALQWNAVERSRRFATFSRKGNAAELHRRVSLRAQTFAEPRAELGHGSNALCIVGRRTRFADIFLDRRAFHQSYDPGLDPDGSWLKSVFAPLPVVCGGINLEYYFSRMDIQGMGAGTKLSHHVIGLFAVSHSADGDLRPGLPLQMVEIHDPIRLLLVVEQTPSVLLSLLDALPDQKRWVDGGWIRLFAAPPSGGIFRYTPEGFVPHPVRSCSRQAAPDWSSFSPHFFATSHQVAETTRENLPVIYSPKS
jgi:MFS superfamily sulfate permease-like transporter/uncharacterized protein YbcC (UPF0753/DUF2309 family)